MLYLEDALALISRHCARLEREMVSLPFALGRTVAVDVVAGANLPITDISTVDGYAVRSADLAGATEEAPISLRMEPPANPFGGAQRPLPQGHAQLLTVGAPLPAGADAVVSNACAASDPAGLPLFMAPAKDGAGLRRRGDELAAGTLVAPGGGVLRSSQLAAMAALGQSTAPVTRRPRVAVVTCGPELVPYAGLPAPGQVRDSLSVVAPAFLAQAGAEVVFTQSVGEAGDQLGACFTTLSQQKDIDLILSIGGLSMAERDAAAETLSRLGQVFFRHVAVRPGRSALFGQLGDKPVLGLPGDPVSARVCLDLFVRPTLDALLGRNGGRIKLEGRWTQPVTGDARRADYVLIRVEWDPSGVWTATPTGMPENSTLGSLLEANAYGVIPVDATAGAAGDPAEIELMEAGVMA